MHLPVVHYILTALATSILWFGLYMHKALGLELTAHKLRMKLHDTDFKYARLLIDYNYLKAVSGYKANSSPSPASNTTSEKAFKTLGLASGASPQEIKNKFRMLIKKYHPDLNKSKDAAAKFKAINEAYKFLNPNK